MKLLISLLVFSQLASAAVTLTISCGSNGIEYQVCKSGAEAYEKQSGNTVKIFSSPNDSNERLALYQQLLGANTSDIDLYQIDVVWPALLDKHFADLSADFSKEELAEHLDSALKNNLVAGKLVAIPWYMDGGLLYYRKDLLKKHGLPVPATWEELGKTSKKILEKEQLAGNKELVGFVFQGRPYEGLTCNALEWISSFGGGSIVDDAGKVTINNPKSAVALTTVAGWIDGIVPKGVLNYTEEEARGVFQSGKAIFMRNWPYAWALLNSNDSQVAAKVGIAPLPSGQVNHASASTLGGWSLAVSKYSKHHKEAVELLKHLTSQAEQKRRAIVASFNPTRLALYSDAEVLKKNPHLKELKRVFRGAIARPSRQTKQQYNKVSAEFWKAVHLILSQQSKPAQALAELETKLTGFSNGGNW